jgi:8-oxo-dGTP pyrophosphatase MutT (NUDIX family)
MEPGITHRRRVLQTPYFTLVAKTVHGHSPDDPFYAIETADYVTIVAVTDKEELLLVRQYRPAVEQSCLELPAGTVDADESPAEAARRELLEETGYLADEIQELGCLITDSARLSNRMWCFFAPGVRRHTTARRREQGIEPVIVPRGRWFEMLRPPAFQHALQMGALFLAVSGGKLTLVP